MSEVPSEFDDRPDIFKPASKAFKYEQNPYERELLQQKEEQVKLELDSLYNHKDQLDHLI